LALKYSAADRPLEIGDPGIGEKPGGKDGILPLQNLREFALVQTGGIRATRSALNTARGEVYSVSN
jgi:hypothetical protein